MRAWQLEVKGIISAGEAEALQLEKKLAAELHAVVSKAEYGAHFSVLGTPSVYGAVHIPQTVSAEDAAPAAPAPAPAPVAPILQAAPAVPTPAAVSLPAEAAALLGGFDPAKLAALAEFAQQLGIGLPVGVPVPQEVPAQQQ